jgi:hypothetical protein
MAGEVAVFVLYALVNTECVLSGGPVYWDRPVFLTSPLNFGQIGSDEGDVDGSTVGNTDDVGVDDGARDGDVEGSSVGAVEGVKVGFQLGTSVGVVGLTLGSTVGTRVGIEGTRVGSLVGC